MYLSLAFKEIFHVLAYEENNLVCSTLFCLKLSHHALFFACCLEASSQKVTNGMVDRVLENIKCVFRRQQEVKMATGEGSMSGSDL